MNLEKLENMIDEAFANERIEQKNIISKELSRGEE